MAEDAGPARLRRMPKLPSVAFAREDLDERLYAGGRDRVRRHLLRPILDRSLPLARSGRRGMRSSTISVEVQDRGPCSVCSGLPRGSLPHRAHHESLRSTLEGVASNRTSTASRGRYHVRLAPLTLRLPSTPALSRYIPMR